MWPNKVVPSYGHCGKTFSDLNVRNGVNVGENPVPQKLSARILDSCRRALLNHSKKLIEDIVA